MKRVIQQGFSLIELMVAMLLGIVLLLGVMQVLISTSSLGTVSNNLSVNQDTARTVLSLLGGEAKRAGYRGCGKGGSLTNASNVNDWNVVAPVLPFFSGGRFGIRFAYGMDEQLVNTNGAFKLKEGGEFLTDCLGKDLYYRSYTYANCTVNSKEGLCINGFSQPTTNIKGGNLVDDEFIEGVTMDKIVFTVPKDSSKFREISVGPSGNSESLDYTSGFESSGSTDVQDVLSANLVTFYITVKTIEPRSSSSTGTSKNTIERTYFASYPLKNVGNE